MVIVSYRMAGIGFIAGVAASFAGGDVKMDFEMTQTSKSIRK